jgi:hypothetical protein
MEPLVDLENLGREVARSEDAIVTTKSEHAALRARVVGSAFSRRRVRLLQRVGAVLGVAAVVTSLFFYVSAKRRGARDLAFDVGGKPGKVGDFLAAPAPSPLDIRFTEGSRARLAPGTKGRVASVSPYGADVVIEAGRADLSVVPREGNRWSVRTGPFVVHVTGTRFSVSWDTTKDAFVLDLFEGKVVVSGCVFGEGETIFGGERVEAACDRGEYRVSPLPVPPNAEQAPAPADEPETSATSRLPDAPAASPRTAEWLSLARKGEYGEAYRIAEAAGFEAQCAHSDVEDLLLLGDAARLSGHSQAARAAYHTIRARFAGTTSAAIAAFYLGRIDLDREADLRSAGKWLETYLAERPNGDLSAAALGRLLEIRLTEGDIRRSKSLAKEYLRRFPRGPHAATANRVLHEGVGE